MYNFVAKRIKLFQDEKGRPCSLETTVADLKMFFSSDVNIQQEINNIIEEIYDNEDGDGIDFDEHNDNGRELEVTGTVLLRLLEPFSKALDKPVSELHEEDDDIDMDDTFYAIEMR